MTDPQFEDLCRLYGFAPSRDLRSLLDAAVQMDRRNSLAPVKTTCKVCGIEGFGVRYAVCTYDNCPANLKSVKGDFNANY